MTAQIDVLVLYTPQTVNRLGPNPMVSIQAVFDLQNEIFTNCKVDAVVRLVGPILFEEFSEDVEIPRELLERPDLAPAQLTGFVFDEIRYSLIGDEYNVVKRRDDLGADLVSIWVELLGEDTFGSYGALLTRTDYQAGIPDASEQFLSVIIAAKAATPVYHFAHELGHNMGLGHDINAGEPSFDLVRKYAHGYVSPDATFRTIMADGRTCNSCARIPYYSSSDPSILYDGKPIGEDNEADNARVLRETTAFVAQYR